MPIGGQYSAPVDTDIAGSSIAPALIESCPTRIFLPNPDAHTPQIADLYESFGLNAQQIRIIAGATPKREYYYQSSSGNRLFELGLGPLMLAAVGSSSPGDQQLMSAVMAKFGEAGFPAAFYAAKGHAEVASFLSEAAPRKTAKVA
jgi:type IV secretory pathway VirB4 component